MPSLEERLDRVVQRLRDEGHRVTPQRMAILRVLLSSRAHPAAEEIYQQVVADFPMLSLATVYKTLHVLQNLGEVMELKVDGRSHYEGDVVPHAHLVCEVCRRIVDLPPRALAGIREEALAGTGFSDLRYDVEVYGLCPQCRQRDNPEQKGGTR